jgi:hypothetical protein
MQQHSILQPFPMKKKKLKKLQEEHNLEVQRKITLKHNTVLSSLLKFR